MQDLLLCDITTKVWAEPSIHVGIVESLFNLKEWTRHQLF